VDRPEDVHLVEPPLQDDHPVHDEDRHTVTVQPLQRRIGIDVAGGDFCGQAGRYRGEHVAGGVAEVASATGVEHTFHGGGR
jgi:hypothetical protein